VKSYLLTVKKGLSTTEESAAVSSSAAWAQPMSEAEDTRAEVRAVLRRMMKGK
jgi:hypothetical protein